MRLTRPGATTVRAAVTSTTAFLTTPRRRQRRYWWHGSFPDVVGDRQAVVGGAAGRQDAGLVSGAVGTRVAGRVRDHRRTGPRGRHRRLVDRYDAPADRLGADRRHVPRAGHGADVLP